MSGISPKGFSQEESYTDALAGRLVSPVYEGEFGFVEFRSTVVNNKGLEAAEKWSGIDFVILATISDDIQRVEKAIVFQ